MNESAPSRLRKWWHRWMLTPGELRELGVVGINMRNARYLLPNNPRSLYRRVDDKLQTKALAEGEGLSVPETYGVIRTPHDFRNFESMLANRDSFVIKPARGSGGKGVLVIDGRDRGNYLKPSGAVITPDELRYHVANILAGMFSLGGTRDCALIEYRVRPASLLNAVSYQGAPDIRIIMLHGYPVMAMLRAATRQSDGRANLHQGALGIGICVSAGRTVRAVHFGKPLDHHPDTKAGLLDIQLPQWSKFLDIAVTCQEMTGLGYLGVDLMIDEHLGPLMIEVNARPGLAIQMANGVGLLNRLDQVVEQHRLHPGAGRFEKIAFSKHHFAARG